MSGESQQGQPAQRQEEATKKTKVFLSKKKAEVTAAQIPSDKAGIDAYP